LATLVVLFSFCASFHPAIAQKSAPKLKAGNAGPEYPEEARQKMIVGDVVFRAEINADGTVKSVGIIRVPEKNIGFEKSIENTVKSWAFEPATENGQPAAGIYVGKVGFSLRPEDEKAIRKAVENASAAWNKGDAKKLASQIDKEGHVFWEETLAQGSKDARKWFDGQFKGQLKGSDVRLTADRIEFFPEADLARVTPTFTLNYKSGENQTSTSGQLNVLLQKDGSKWIALSSEMVRQVGERELHAPKIVNEVEPEYPDRARKDRVQGTVVLEGNVDAQGKVSKVEVIRSIPELDEAAVDAVKKWQYEPATVDGVATPMTTTMTVNFLIEE
jgi:TonB family protein